MSANLGRWVTWYVAYRDRAVQVRGAGAKGVTGAQLPVTLAHDPFLMLAAIVPDVIAAIEKATGMKVATVKGADRASTQCSMVTIEDWLSQGRAQGDDSSVRYLNPSGIGGELFRAPFEVGVAACHYQSHAGSRTPNPDGRLRARQVVSKWNRCIEAAAAALATATIQPRLPDATAVEWWSRFYALIIAVEVEIDLPSPSTWERLEGGLRAATAASIDAAQSLVGEGAKVAGAAAAELAKTAGIAAGSFSQGFFGQAGITAYLVVAVAIYVYLG